MNCCFLSNRCVSWTVDIQYCEGIVFEVQYTCYTYHTIVRDIIIPKIQLDEISICEENLNDIHSSICLYVIPFEI